MKKLMMLACMAFAAFTVNAAAMNWKVTGAAATKDYSVYFLLADAVADSYASASDIVALTGGSGTVAQSGRAYAVQGSISDSSLTKGAELAMIIVNADQSQYAVVTGISNSMIYDPAAQESAPGQLPIANSILTGASYQSFASVPEPTSGLLLLLGMAGLALRRKQK